MLLRDSIGRSTHKLFNMKSHSPSHTPFDPKWDLAKRIEIVMSIHQSIGHVNRKVLMQSCGATQLQAGSLMRDFIHAHAKNLEWDVTHSHYSMKN